jgi:arylsulfatase A-like enzyme
MTRPNVLLVTIDQIRADAIFGALGASVPLPNIRRLAASGTTFANHFTVTAPCGPARASLLTGLYAMNHRVIRNGAPLARYHTNLALEARKGGYEPLLFGYTDVQADPTDRAPGDPDLASYEGVLPGFRELVELRFDSPRAWPAHLAAAGYALPDKVEDLWKPVSPSGGAPAIRDPAFYDAKHSDTAFLTDETLRALSVRTKEPWFAHVTYIRPHPPLVAPVPYNLLVDAAGLPAPIAAMPDHPFLTAWSSEPAQSGLYWGFDGDFARMDERTVRDLRAVYLGLLAEVDHHLGRILDWLDDTGQAGNTLVVVTGDHGEMLGDHGVWGKDTFFDPVFNVPLVIRMPGRAKSAGSVVEAITESVDIAPTILAALGLAVPAAMDGQPLQPLLDGVVPEGWRCAAFSEADFSVVNAPTRFERALKLGPLDANMAVLREARWKYVHFNGGLPPLLFDLEGDPHETRNLAAERPDEVARLRAVMLDRRMSRGFRGLTEWGPERAPPSLDGLRESS